jgi:hypothetical protein
VPAEEEWSPHTVRLDAVAPAPPVAGALPSMTVDDLPVGHAAPSRVDVPASDPWPELPAPAESERADGGEGMARRLSRLIEEQEARGWSGSRS